LIAAINTTINSNRFTARVIQTAHFIVEISL